MKWNNFDKVINLLKEYHDNDIKENDLNKKLKEIDKESLFYALYFTRLDKDYYKKQYYKTKSDLIDRKYFTF
jgi:hypothetical protein